MTKEKVIKLNDKQERFATEVVKNGGDKVQAFKASGWSWGSYTLNALGVQADKAFNHPKISLRIAELQALKEEVAEEDFKIDARYVLKRLHDIDNLDVLDIMEDDLKSFKKLSEWPKVWRISVSGIDLMTMAQGDTDIDSIIKKIKWPDKTKNLELLGKHVGVNAFKEVIEHTGEVVCFNMNFGGVKNES